MPMGILVCVLSSFHQERDLEFFCFSCWDTKQHFMSDAFPIWGSNTLKNMKHMSRCSTHSASFWETFEICVDGATPF